MADTNEVMRAYLDRVVAGDFQGAMDYYADDVVGHVGGNNATSGVYLGKEEWRAYLAKAVGMVDSMRIEDHDLLTSEDHAVVLNTFHAERGGNSLSSHRVVIYHVSDGKVTELWVVDEDQQAVDEFLS